MNKTLTSIFILTILILVFSCSQKKSKSDSVALTGTVETAVNQIQNFQGDVKDFRLGLKDELISNSFSMAIITDAMLKKGWTFNSTKKIEGGEIFFYKKME